MTSSPPSLACPWRLIVSQKQAHVWSASNWVQDSQVRTQQWRAGQYNAPVAWIWNEGKSIPRDAIQGGEERGEHLYICRVYHEVRTCHTVVNSATDVHTINRAESVSLSLAIWEYTLSCALISGRQSF